MQLPSCDLHHTSPTVATEASTMPEVFSYAVVTRLRSAADGKDVAKALRWFRARRDAYIDADVWDAMNARDHHVALAHIACAASARDRLISHRTAALVWDIPLIGELPGC